ncbi:MAG: hypothetical protein RR323_01005 [Raoultibacter sp.]
MAAKAGEGNMQDVWVCRSAGAHTAANRWAAAAGAGRAGVGRG